MSRLFARKTELFLLLVATVLLALLLAALELSRGNALTTDMLVLIGGFIGVFGVAHLVLCFATPHADQILLPVAAALNAVGLVIIYRLDLALGNTMATRQVLWTFVGVVLMVIVVVVLSDHKTLTRYSYLLGLIGLILLALPLVWPQGNNVTNARIWIYIGPFSIQPAEFSKILLIMFFALLLTQKRALFTVAGYRVFGLVLPRLRDLAPILLVWGIAIIIMAISNDFGPALLLFATVLGMMYIATQRLSWLLIGVVLVAVGGTAVYLVSTKIQERVALFLDPIGSWDISDQIASSLFGMSWGGVTGAGLGDGYSWMIPVAHSDFILAAVGEELGFAGLSAVLILFAIFVSRGFHVALTVRDTYGKLLAAGLSLTIAIQVFVVTAGVSALMPLTGLTTPFMSAGGSALMANYILLGLLLRISNSARRPDSLEASEAHARQVRAPRTPQGAHR